MFNYLIILIRVLFVGNSYNDIANKLAVSVNTDNTYIVQVATSPEQWQARDRSYKVYKSTNEISDFLNHNPDIFNTFVDVQLYDVKQATFTYLPPRLDIQKF